MGSGAVDIPPPPPGFKVVGEAVPPPPPGFRMMDSPAATLAAPMTQPATGQFSPPSAEIRSLGGDPRQQAARETLRRFEELNPALAGMYQPGDALPERGSQVRLDGGAKGAPRMATVQGEGLSSNEGLLMGLRQGATFGLGDEVSAGIRSLGPLTYDQALEGERALVEDARKAGGYNAGNLIGAVAGGPGKLLTGLAARGVSAGAKIAYGALAGATGGAIQGAGEAEGGAAQRVTGALEGAALGGIAGAALPIGINIARWAGRKGGAALRGLMSDPRIAANGAITEEGKTLLGSLGYDVKELTDDFARTFQTQVDRGLAPQQAAATADLAEFGIPATRANVTGLADDFAVQERAYRGAVGATAERKAKAVIDGQTQARQDAAERIAMGLGGKAGDQADAAVSIMGAAKGARDTAKAAARDAYGVLEGIGGGLSGEAVRGLGRQIATSLKVAGRTVDRAATNANATLRALDETFASAKGGSVPFMQIERARQTVQRNLRAAQRGDNGADQSAMSDIVDTFDRKVDDLFMTGLTQGDDGFLKAAQKARGLWKGYVEQFEGKGAASRFVQKMTDADASPDDVVKWLFGAGKLGTGQFNSTVAKGLKEVIGGKSDAWNELRQAAFRRMTQRPDGVEQWGPQAVFKQLGEFLTSPATRELAGELFTKQEAAVMRRYAAALKRLVPPPGAVNYSGTAYENARMASTLWQTIANGIGVTSGGLPGLVASEAAGRVSRAGKGWLTARRILSPDVKPPLPPTSRVQGAATIGLSQAPQGQEAQR
jgi:hypothetical protein